MSERKVKNKYFDLKFKADLLRQLERGATTAKLSRKHHIPVTTLRGWIQNKRKILLAAAKCTSSVKSMKPAEHPALEQNLYEWIATQRSVNIELTTDAICEQARLIHEQLRIQEGQSNKMKDFKGSRSWFDRFKERFRLKYLKN